MSEARTPVVVASMLAVSLAVSPLLAWLQFSAFFLYTFLVPALIAAFYQWRHGIRFEKRQRIRISFWYMGISAVIGIIPLALLVNEQRDRLNEPFAQVVMALVFAVIALLVLGYFVVYWMLGLNYSKRTVNS